jgi:1,4-dihydroxy-2-naphthoyl-CoA hydrolase
MMRFLNGTPQLLTVVNGRVSPWAAVMLRSGMAHDLLWQAHSPRGQPFSGSTRSRVTGGRARPEVTVEQDSAQLITETFIERSKDTLVSQMGIKIVEAAAQRVVGTMPVTGNTQPYGLLHGGASCVLAETLGSLGSALHAGTGRFTVGIEISATHHRAAASGLVTGVATLLHGGRTVTTYEIVISDDRDRRVCTARLTCLLSDRVPGGGGPGVGGGGAAGPGR